MSDKLALAYPRPASDPIKPSPTTRGQYLGRRRVRLWLPRGAAPASGAPAFDLVSYRESNLRRLGSLQLNGNDYLVAEAILSDKYELKYLL